MLATGKPIEYIPLRASPSLLHDAGLAFLQQLEAVASLHSSLPQAKAGVTICLVQKDSSSESSELWANHLRRELLHAELWQRILYFRKVLRLLQHSPCDWIFLGRGSCLGSFWELALSCSQRFWFSCEGQLGFPDISLGLFPLGGSLESLAETFPHSREEWEEKPVMSVAEAVRRGFIDYWGGEGGEAAHWEQVLENSLPSARKRSVAKITLDRKRPSWPLAKQQRVWSWEAVQALEREWLQSQHGSDAASAWVYGWNLHKGKRWFPDEQAYEHCLAFMAARFMLLEKKTPYRQNLQLDPGEGGEPVLSSPLYVDCRQAAPPLALVIKLLKSHHQLVYVSDHPKELLALLERTFLKIERQAEKHALLLLWQKQISWFIGPGVESHCPCLKPGLGDRMELVMQQKRHAFINLEASRQEAPFGVWESLQPQGEQARGLDALLAEMGVELIYPRRVMSPQGSLSSWLRLMFLQEMIGLSARHEGDIAKLLASLEDYGWRFAASPESWDHFLQTQGHSFGGGTEGCLMPLKEVQDLAGWKRVQALVRRAGESRKRRANPMGLNLHLSLFAAALGDYLFRQGFLVKREQADLLVHAALGFPASATSPEYFATFWGVQRFQLYRDKYWPTLAAACASAKPNLTALGGLADDV